VTKEKESERATAEAKHGKLQRRTVLNSDRKAGPRSGEGQGGNNLGERSFREISQSQQIGQENHKRAEAS